MDQKSLNLPDGGEAAQRPSGNLRKKGVNWRTNGATGQNGRVSQAVGLRERLEILLREETKATNMANNASEAFAPHKAAFDAATEHLLYLWRCRNQGEFVSKATMLKAYDARMEAGHAGNPAKQRMREAERWLKDLRNELRIVNQEIGE